MPAHRTYVEAFLGKGVVLRAKLPARVNIGIELDPIVISRYWCRRSQSVQILQADALTMLPALKLDSTALVYCDPPYPASVRAQSNRIYYGRELLSESEHDILLSVLTGLQCMVMVSGYQNDLYSRKLASWRHSQKWTVNRAGQRVQECIWMNFPEPVFFHDTRYVGYDFTDRQRIKRKVARWKRKFLTMPAEDRAAIWDALSAMVDGPASQEQLSSPA